MTDPSTHSDLRSLVQGGDNTTPSLEAVVNETRSRMDPMAQERAELADRLRTGKVSAQDNRPLLELAGIVGAGCLLLGFASMAFTVGVHPASIGLAGLGALLAGGYAAADWQRVKGILTSRNALYSANLSVTVGVLFAILVVVNMLANRYYTVFDLTSNGINSLSPQSLELLKKLKDQNREITITAFYPKDQANKDDLRAMETVFGRYTHEHPRLNFSIVDPDVHAALAKEKNITVPGTILFESGDNSTRIVSLGEREITGALLKVTDPETKIVYFVTGHNEYSTDDNAKDGLATLAEILDTENLVVKQLSIPQAEHVPADAAAVILVSPQSTPLQVRELNALDEYLARGGNLMVLLEPFSAPEVVQWLAGYGLTVRADMVIDTEFKDFDDTSPVLAPLEGDHPLLPTLAAAAPGIVTPSARSLDPTNGKATWTPLYATEGPISFGETDTSKLEYTEGTDTVGPLSVVVAGVLKSTDGKGGRLFVAGDADWITNNSLAKFNNQDFAVNSIAWLVGSEDQIAIRPGLPNLARVQFKGNSEKFMMGTVFGIPLVVAFGGVLIWWKRRSW